MGQTEPRHWDERTYTSRPARPDDPPRSVFHAYVPHPIRDWTPDLSALTWDLVSAATQRCRELQRSDAHGPLPAEWLLSRAESIASSTIEEIRPSARGVARAEAQLRLFGEQPPEVEMQALRNIRITQHARDVADSGAEMSIDLLRRLHATLMGDDDPIAGQLRDRQNWVGAGALGGPLRARHVGPPAELVPELLDDLAAFANRADDGFPLVRAALAHAQFETIHPFPDGNGRTGRAVLQYMYAREGMSEGAALPVSSALMLAKTDYFDALDESRVLCAPNAPERSQSLRSWIEMLAHATDHACRLHERLNRHVEFLSQHWSAVARSRHIRPSSAAFRLLSHLPTAPIVTAESVQDALRTTDRTARNAISRLVDAGILVQRSAGRRNRVFECADMMDAFTESAREQPADALTLESSDAPHVEAGAVSAARSSAAAGTADSAQWLCNARTARGGACTHPRPKPGGCCPAGHEHPSPAPP